MNGEYDEHTIKQLTNDIFLVASLEDPAFEQRRSFPKERRICGNPTYTFVY